ncbi:MAG: hypothetical protein IV108_00595 [Burkholderiales bacterium]|nr:hypothetical protein [Burkholderiales bacterium]
MKTTISLLLASLAIFAGQAYAEQGARHHRPRDPGVNQRQHNQQDRIKQGVRSGQLTKEETRDLRSEQKAIRQEERAYKSDGKLTKEERKDLHQDMNALSKDIYQEKHDGDVRPKAVK